MVPLPSSFVKRTHLQDSLVCQDETGEGIKREADSLRSVYERQRETDRRERPRARCGCRAQRPERAPGGLHPAWRTPEDRTGICEPVRDHASDVARRRRLALPGSPSSVPSTGGRLGSCRVPTAGPAQRRALGGSAGWGVRGLNGRKCRVTYPDNTCPAAVLSKVPPSSNEKVVARRAQPLLSQARHSPPRRSV